MSCAGQVLARFAARSRSFHLVAGRDPRSSRRDHPALLAPTYSTGFFVRDSFNHVSKLVSTDSPQSADLVRAYEAVSIRVGQGDRNFWKQFPEKSWNATD